MNKKNKALVVVSIVVGVVALLLGGAYWGFKAFMSRLSDMSVYIEDLETGSSQKISTLSRGVSPVFSPDGQQILYRHILDDGTGELRIYNLKTQQSTILKTDTEQCYTPLWHPSGESIFYVGKKNNQKDIWQFELKGGKDTQLTNDPFSESDIQLSNDGKWLLFTEKRNEGREELFVMPAVGGEKVQVTQTDSFLAEIKDPAWAPNSKEFAFVSFLTLMIMNMDGEIVEEIDLTGLNNFSDLSFWPGSDDIMVLKARPAAGVSLSFNLYKVSRSSGSFEVWKTDRGMVELGHNISSDLSLMTYSK